MSSFVVYLFDIVVADALLALALSIYVDGIGYLVFHVMALAGIGAYVYGIASGPCDLPPVVACGMAVIAGAMTGFISAEILRPLRGDNLTLVSFGLGVCAFEMFRFSKTTGGVFGMASIPTLLPKLPHSETAMAGTILSVGLAIVLVWRRSITGKVAVALRLDEEGAVSIGARLGAHQRLTGMLAGILASLSGVWIAATTHFIEPRQFQTSGIVIALTGVVAARGYTPFGVVTVVAAIVVGSQGARFLSESAVLAGPITEMVVASTLGIVLVATRYRTRLE
jgi:ABC-type branched-subunit amino acid transport system permease subunit